MCLYRHLCRSHCKKKYIEPEAAYRVIQSRNIIELFFFYILVFLSNLYREISVISVQTFFGKGAKLESDHFQRAVKVRNTGVLSEIHFFRKNYFKEVFKGF